MWMIRWFFIALVIALISLFIGKNYDNEPVKIDYLFGVTEEMSPLLAMFFSFVLGFLTWFVVSLFNFMKMRSDIASKGKLIKNLKEELNSYRNAALSVSEDAEKTVLVDRKKVGGATAEDVEEEEENE
jgi:uncharacterized membrane protein YciS (DUF1049 family)